MKNLYLVGFMGTGKTVVGKILAEKLGREFVEMDAVIAKREGKEIVDIFAEKGEAYFRKLERALLEELCEREDLIISCGGGLVCGEDNLSLLKRTGTVVTLRASPSVIYGRTKKGVCRPILNVDNPQAKIKELLEARDKYYKQGDYLVNTDNVLPLEVADKIITIMNNG